MLSRSSVYALRAALYLAQAPGGLPISAARMASELDVPREYLAKILGRLRREGILMAVRGAKGGYRLGIPGTELRIATLVAPFDDLRPPAVCLLGGACDPEAPCSAHQRRMQWNQARLRLLSATTISELLDGTPPGPVPAGAAEQQHQHIGS